MKAVIQRVLDASVSVDKKEIGGIKKGLLVYLGVMQNDTKKEAEYLSQKIQKLRIFQDKNDKMNLCVTDIGGGILVVSQFTLCADLKKGNRPSFNPAAPPNKANELYEYFMQLLIDNGLNVAHGEFGAHMNVSYQNDGPVTIIYNTDEML